MKWKRRRKEKIVVCLLISFFVANIILAPSYTESITGNKPMTGIKILFLVDQNFDTDEYFGAKNHLEGLGCTSYLAGPTTEVQSMMGDNFTVDILFSEIVITDYDCMYIPGGGAADYLIQRPGFLSMIQDANDLGICLAAICYGTLVFAVADIVDGRNVTGYVQSDLVDAGGNYIDARAVIDGNLVTANYPYIIDSCRAIIEVLGFYDPDSPEIGTINYDLITTPQGYNCSFEITVTDAFVVSRVSVSAYKIIDDITSLFKSTVLTDPDANDIFTGTLDELEPGNYSFQITVEDYFTNEFTNNSFLTLDLKPTSAAGIDITQNTFLFSIFCIYIITLRVKKTHLLKLQSKMRRK